jgi:NTP pyrophosphatase (non-canonical NTP hydrolase)
VSPEETAASTVGPHRSTGTGEERRGNEPLDLDAYQEGALRTALYPAVGGHRFVYPALGLANEAGEVLGKIKKLFRDRGGRVTPEFREEIKKELGDVQWYVAVLAHEFGLSASDVARANLEKLASRAERGVLGGDGDER